MTAREIIAYANARIVELSAEFKTLDANHDRIENLARQTELLKLINYAKARA